MNKSSKLTMVMACAMMFMATGCWRPYAKPIQVEIQHNQSAFLVPMEGDITKQVKFESVDQIKEMKVSVNMRRITIPVKWFKTGYGRSNGKYQPTATVVLVDRTPVSKRWVPYDDGSGTSKQSLEAESKDSVGISSGFAITAYVKDEDAATYLYWFPGKDLGYIIDNQIFNACQSVYSEQCGKWEVKEIRLHKEEISNAIRTTVIPEFAKYGITIDPTLGLIGGLMYDNPKIQEAIDTVFIAQTMEAKREADRIAQVKQNELDLSVEQNEAAKRKVKADAEAYEVAAKAKAVKEGGDMYLQLLTLEVEKQRILKWNGDVPTVQLGGGNGSGASSVVPIMIPAIEPK